MGIFTTTTVIGNLMPGIDMTVNANSTVASLSIDWAETKIRSILSQRYDVAAARFQTSTATPPFIQSLCQDLAIGRTYLRLSRGTSEPNAAAQSLMDNAIKELKLLSRDFGHLVDSVGSIVPDRGTREQVRSNTSTYTETFLEDDPVNWAVDQDKLDDIETSRD